MSKIILLAILCLLNLKALCLDAELLIPMETNAQAQYQKEAVQIASSITKLNSMLIQEISRIEIMNKTLSSNLVNLKTSEALSNLEKSFLLKQQNALQSNLNAVKGEKNGN